MRKMTRPVRAIDVHPSVLDDFDLFVLRNRPGELPFSHGDAALFYQAWREAFNTLKTADNASDPAARLFHEPGERIGIAFSGGIPVVIPDPDLPGLVD